MNDAQPTPEPGYPQDTPTLRTPTPNTPTPSPPTPSPPTPSPPTPSPPTPSALPAPVREVTHLPPPGAPNWGLVLSGLAFMVIAAGVILNQVNGFQVQELQQVGPTLLVALGVGSALIGVIGLMARRGR